MGVQISPWAHNMNRKIILASTSPKRKEILEKTGIVFEVVPSDYQEDMTLPLTPQELAKFLSKGKAEAAAKNFANAIIIAADTFIVFKNEIIGKPHTKERAREMLKKLSNNMHYALTGFTVLDTKTSKIISKTVQTKLIFKKLTDEMIDDYIEKGNPLKYAGSYTLNDISDKFIEKIEGDPLNVIGLPISSVLEVLKEFGVEVKN